MPYAACNWHGTEKWWGSKAVLPRHEGIHGGTGGFQSFLCYSQNKCSFINWEKNRGEKGKKKKKTFYLHFLKHFLCTLLQHTEHWASQSCPWEPEADLGALPPARRQPQPFRYPAVQLGMLLWSGCQTNGELDKVWVQQKWLHLEEQGQHHDFQLTSQGCSRATAQLEAATCIPPEHLTWSPGLLQNQRLLQKSCKPKSLHTLQHPSPWSHHC